MSRRIRQYIGLVAAVVLYYVIHEGAHLAVALALGVFKQINIIGLGMQIDVFAEQMTSSQMGWFCAAGPIATFVAGWLLVIFTSKICNIKSALIRTCAWYTALTMLILDPLYLGLFYRWVGGGDMNGIALIVPEVVASVVAAIIGVVNIIIIWKVLYPAYTRSFAEEKK